MKLKAVVNTLDDLDDAVKALYSPLDGADGMFVLGVEPVEVSVGGSTRNYGLEDVHGLKSTIGNLRRIETEFDTGKRVPTAYNGITPDQAATFKTQAEELSAIDPNKKADQLAAAKVKAREEQLLAEFKTERDQLSQKKETLFSQLKQVMVTEAALAAIKAHGGKPELLLSNLTGNADLREGPDGKFGVVLLDAAGNPEETLQGDKMVPTTFSTKVSGWKANPGYAGAFDGDGSTGGDSRSSDARHDRTKTPPPPGGDKPEKTVGADSGSIGSNLAAIAEGKTQVEGFTSD